MIITAELGPEDVSGPPGDIGLVAGDRPEPGGRPLAGWLVNGRSRVARDELEGYCMQRIRLPRVETVY